MTVLGVVAFVAGVLLIGYLVLALLRAEEF